MKNLISLVLLFALCFTILKCTSSVISEEHVVANIMLADRDQDGQNDVLFIEYYIDGQFDKVLVYDSKGKYIGKIYKQDLLWIFEDKNCNKTIIENLPDIKST